MFCIKQAWKTPTIDFFLKKKNTSTMNKFLITVHTKG
jgi:hypothetical protein